MKTNKVTLGMETLNARCLMSATPLGIAAPAPEPPSSDSLSYNFSGIEGSVGATHESIWVGTDQSAAAYGKQNKLQEVRARTVADIDKAAGGAISAGAGSGYAPVIVVTDHGQSSRAVEMEDVFVSSAHGGATAAKVVVRWEKISVPVTDESADGGIVSEGQGYGIAAAGDAEDPESIWSGTAWAATARGFQTPIETTTFVEGREVADDEVDLGGEGIWTPEELDDVYKIKSRARLIGLEIVT